MTVVGDRDPGDAASLVARENYVNAVGVCVETVPNQLRHRLEWLPLVRQALHMVLRCL